ncbi:MAG: valine--tRNA ligase [Candidatus Nitrosopolaris sp.]
MVPRIESKLWNPALERSILQKWDINEIYKFSIDESRKAFVIDTPPPYPSGRPWHVGAAAHYSQIDMIARTSRMMGYNVLFPIGIDRNGLPVEIYTEKKYKIVMRKTDREKFLELCAHALDDLEDEMIQIMKTLGISGNFDEYYRTDSEKFRALTQSTFIYLWKQNLVYRANRPNNYCSQCATTIADSEIIYETIPTKLIYMRFAVKETGKNIIIASTRPELLFACQLIIVNPNDERYLNLVEKHAIIPIFNREVKIMAHPSAKPEFGSGAVMVCSYGDENDVRIFRELGLKEIVSLDEYGRTSSAAGSYSNLAVNEARIKIVEELKNIGIIEKEENIMHRTPICERSKTPIEIISLEDYYVKQIDYIPVLRELANKITFHPDMHRQILLNWLNAIAIDWPVTRRRFYGTEVPIWYCINCRCPNLPDAGKYYRPWKERPPFEKCSNCGGTEFIGEDRTFDTWMDSSISPLFITKYKNNSQFYDYTYPTTLRPQGKDIIRTWLYYTLLRCFQLTSRLPWSDAWIMGYGLDEKGEKMSKSKGNVVDPFPLIRRHGADVFRLWAAAESNLGYDFRYSERRIISAKNFLSKLWNIGRFLSSFDVISKTPTMLSASDRWVIGELSKLIDQCREGYDNFNFFIPANEIREFTWNIFAAHYIEMIKGRIYDSCDRSGQRSAIFTSHKCFSTILVLLAPICPFITEELWTRIYSVESIHLQRLPESLGYYELTKYTKSIMDFNSTVWNKKKETISEETGKPLSLKDSIGGITIPHDLDVFKEDLKMMHNLKG